MKPCPKLYWKHLHPQDVESLTLVGKPDGFECYTQDSEPLNPKTDWMVWYVNYIEEYDRWQVYHRGTKAPGGEVGYASSMTEGMDLADAAFADRWEQEGVAKKLHWVEASEVAKLHYGTLWYGDTESGEHEWLIGAKGSGNFTLKHAKWVGSEFLFPTVEVAKNYADNAYANWQAPAMQVKEGAKMMVNQLLA